MMTLKKWPYAALILIVLFFSGCSKNKTELVSSWSDPKFNGPPLQRVLVLGVMNNGLNRHIYEDTLVETFRASGVDAIPSHSLMPKLEDFQDKAKIMATVQESGADSVLLAVLIGKGKHQQNYATHSLYDYYGQSYRSLRDPNTRSNHTEIQLETTIFRTATKEILWAGSTKSYNPDSAQNVLVGNTTIIQTSLKKMGLLP